VTARTLGLDIPAKGIGACQRGNRKVLFAAVHESVSAAIFLKCTVRQMLNIAADGVIE